MNRQCPVCGADPRLADDPVTCGHSHDTYCSPVCARFDCSMCYAEHHEL